MYDRAMRIVGIIGMIFVILGLIVPEERKRFALFIIGGFGLFLYSFYIGDWIFILLQIAFVGFSYNDFRKAKFRKPYTKRIRR